MSWGISPNATEKEKIFADFADFLNGLNSAGGLSYHHYSQIFDIGRKLADEEYEQGRADVVEEVKQKQRVIIDEDGVMHKVVFLKDLEQMQKGAEE